MTRSRVSGKLVGVSEHLVESQRMYYPVAPVRDCTCSNNVRREKKAEATDINQWLDARPWFVLLAVILKDWVNSQQPERLDLPRKGASILFSFIDRCVKLYKSHG